MQTNDYTNCDLNEIFATKLAESHEFRAWLLSRTKFARLWPLARLLNEDQARANSDDKWWRNGSSEHRGDRATKMLFVFEVDQTMLRFALHVETLTRVEYLDVCDSSAFRRHALSMLNQPLYMNYLDFETVLLAPQALIIKDARTLNFDRRVPFETIAGFVPEFANALQVAA